jgi:hypothetical protein
MFMRFMNWCIARTALPIHTTTNLTKPSAPNPNCQTRTHFTVPGLNSPELTWPQLPYRNSHDSAEPNQAHLTKARLCCRAAHTLPLLTAIELALAARPKLTPLQRNSPGITKHHITITALPEPTKTIPDGTYTNQPHKPHRNCLT